uniref:RRM domain-containing protein n=1 Tax=Steinernema glaseri TaxID=37863 RepID=A0A1I7YG94_9BILA
MPPYPGPPFLDGYPLGGPPQMGGEQNMGGPRPNAPFLMADPRETERTVEELTRAKERLTAELDSKERTIAELLEKCARMQVNEAELHVHNIHPDVTQAQILEKFSSIGQVSSTEISRDLSTPSSTASATVSFKHAEDAERAIDTLYGERMKGEPIRIFWSPDSERGRLNNLRRVFVMNLERDIDDDALRHHFEGFGPIVVARVVRSQDERCVGFGFVRFEGVGDADKAVAEMNKTVLLSKTIAVYRHK